MNRTVLLLMLCVQPAFVAVQVRASDAHCGPRCVQQVLADYGHDVDLIDLVREIQYPNIKMPAPLDRLQASLESPGIHAVAIRTGRFASVQWQHPMIIHVLAPTGDGHYVTRNTTENPTGDESQFGRTGVYLLTSPDPIDQAAVRDATSGSKVFLGLGVLCLAVVSAAGIVRLRSRRHVHPTCVLVFVFAVCGGLGDNVFAQSADADATAELYQFVMAGIQAERESLVTGVFEAEEKFRPVEGQAYDSQIFCAFDHATRKLRFDRIKKVPDDPAATRLGGYYVATPESVVYRQVNKDVVAVRPADFQTEISEPFDVRVLGLAHWPDFLQDTRFQTIYDIYTSPRAKPTQVTTEGDSFRIIRIFEARRVKREIIVDGSKGFWPIRFSLCRRDSKDSEQWHAPEMDSDLNVEQVGTTWVPTKFNMQNQGNSIEVTFHWKSVNEAIPARTFTYEDFDLQGVSRVVDGHLGQPVVLKVLGAPQAERGSQPAGQQAVQSNTATWVLMVLGLGALVLVGILITLMRAGNS